MSGERFGSNEYPNKELYSRRSMDFLVDRVDVCKAIIRERVECLEQYLLLCLTSESVDSFPSFEIIAVVVRDAHTRCRRARDLLERV